MRESTIKKCFFYFYSLSAYLGVKLLKKIMKQKSHSYFTNSKTVIDIYKQYGFMNIIRASIRVPKNLNMSTTGFKLFKNAYFPKTTKTILSTSIEITHSCPYKCKGCYIDSENKKSNFYMEESTLRKTIESLSHSTFILIQGGEPLQRDSVEMVYNVLKDYPEQIFVMVTTGVYISKYGLGKFANLDNILWSISVNGTEEVNDTLRFKGSFKHAINAIDQIRIAQQYFVATVTLSKENVENATSKEFILLLADKGVKEIRYLILRTPNDQLSLEEIEYYEKKTKPYNRYLFCNFCIDNLEDYSITDPFGNIRIDRTGYDHTLSYQTDKSRAKHYF